MTTLDPAERLLLNLGITEPDEIDVEVIAFMVGAIVRYRPLAGADARIMGVGDRAIITVDDAASRVRQRFSVAHELGHWHHHRGQRLACHATTQPDPSSIGAVEREADRYAASLLMPRFMLTRVVAKTPMSMALVHHVAERFHVSRFAATLRLVETHTDAFAVVVEESDGRRWFKRSQGSAPRWFVWMDGPSNDLEKAHRAHRATCWYRGPGLGGRHVSFELQRLTDGRVLHLIGEPT